MASRPAWALSQIPRYRLLIVFTVLNISDTHLTFLNLLISTPTLGSLVGYTGGPLTTSTPVPTVFTGNDPAICGGCGWNLVSGALTQAVTAPEPSSIALMLLGVGLVFAVTAIIKTVIRTSGAWTLAI
jgi:hypothetical protein